MIDQSAQSISTAGSRPSLPSPADLRQPLVHATEGAEAGPSLTAKVAGARVVDDTFHAVFSENVHSYIREHIRNADQKAAFFFAALTAILAFLNTQRVPARFLKDVRLWSIMDGLGFVGMVGLAFGAVFMLSVIFPRLRGSLRGLVFFNAISEYDNAAEYTDDVLATPREGLVRIKFQHCYEVARICSAKYRLLRFGFWIGSVGAAAALAFLVLSLSA